ncbi:beta-1,3-galactosyltransferase 2-like isoform X2 [Macrobrachium rosenbergii]|uniref:beta-1,3-galactosyltransferase 2-like isoform X2 n=1 Tax=Macrobrachium rosenbergii TaxID=79674 RepID=UPI0034D40764
MAITRTLLKSPHGMRDRILALLVTLVFFHGLIYVSRIPTGLRYFQPDTRDNQFPLLFEINCTELMSRKPANASYEKFCIFNDTTNATWMIPITNIRSKLSYSEMSHASTLSMTTWQKVLPERPFKDRFKFIYKNRPLELDGPVVNPIPSSITWQEDLHHVQICNSTSPFMLAVVPSAVPNKDKRDVIRRTWASPSLYSHISLRNLTYKTMAWLTWVNKSCPEVPFVVKIDDDVIFNPFHLKEYLTQQLRRPMYSKPTQSLGWPSQPRSRPEMSLESRWPGQSNPATKWIYGCLETRPSPHRQHKWGVSMEEYPEPVYPPFVLGPAYVVGGSAVGRLLKYAPHVPLLWLEDVYTTGLVAQAAQIRRVQARPLYVIGGRTFSLDKGARSFWTEHGNSDKTYVWQKILSHSNIT